MHSFRETYQVRNVHSGGEWNQMSEGHRIATPHFPLNHSEWLCSPLIPGYVIYFVFQIVIKEYFNINNKTTSKLSRNQSFVTFKRSRNHIKTSCSEIILS